MDVLSIAGDVLHLAIAVPMLIVGILIGAIGYRYLLKKDPTLLNSLVTKAQTELKSLAEKASVNATLAPTPGGVATAPILPAPVQVPVPAPVTQTPVPAVVSTPVVVPVSTPAPVQAPVVEPVPPATT
jgi:hypothetical protein